MRDPPELAAEMMKPYGGAMDIWEVGKDVGNVRNNKPELLHCLSLKIGSLIRDAISGTRSLPKASKAPLQWRYRPRRGGYVCAVQRA